MIADPAGRVMETVIETSRLRLRCWSDADYPATPSRHCMLTQRFHDLGGPVDRDTSDAKFDRYRAAYRRLGYC